MEGGPRQVLASLASQLRLWEEISALLSDSDPGSPGEVEILGNLGSHLDFIVDTVADHLGHPSLVSVPVHLEAIRVLHVQVVGSDEVEGSTVWIRADTLYNNCLEARLRMYCLSLSVLNAEFVVAMIPMMFLLDLGFWRLLSPPWFYYNSVTRLLHVSVRGRLFYLLPSFDPYGVQHLTSGRHLLPASFLSWVLRCFVSSLPLFNSSKT